MDDHHRDLPFSAEYAKSGRAGCKACGDTIEKDTLRLAIMVQVMNDKHRYQPNYVRY